MTTPIEQARRELHRAAKFYSGLATHHRREQRSDRHRDLVDDLDKLALDARAAAEGLDESTTATMEGQAHAGTEQT